MRFIGIIEHMIAEYVNIEATDESKAKEILEDYVDELNNNSKQDEAYEEEDLISEKDLKYLTNFIQRKAAVSEWLGEDEE